MSSQSSFLAQWFDEDVTAVLANCSTSAEVAAGVRAAHAWVRHDPEHRRQHWEGMVKQADLSKLSKAEMVALRTDIDDATLLACMFAAAVAKLPK